MKLRQITENDEYAGLEDADEFGEESLGNCTHCNRDIPVDTGGAWQCEHDDQVAHFSCAMPSQQDLHDYENEKSGILSSGWYFERQAGPFKRNWNVLNGTRVSAAARAYDKYLCPTCARAHLIEDIGEYEGLEDADEFHDEDNPDVTCTNCGFSEPPYDSMHTWCMNCNTAWCTNCVAIQIHGIQTMYNPDNHTIDYCPRCRRMQEMRKPHGPFTEGISEYEGLEDADEFSDDEPPQHIQIDQDFVQLFSQWYKGQDDPIYAVVSRAIAERGRHQSWTGEEPADGNEWPKNLLVSGAEANAIVDTAVDAWYSPYGEPKDKKIAEKYLNQLGYNIRTLGSTPVTEAVSDEYAGLEDADEFEENQDEQEIEAMNEMGYTPDSLGIPPELQLHGIELSSGAHAYWSKERLQWVHEDYF